MARIEADREDLMREATGLSPRGEIHVPHSDTPVVAGFRSGDRCSVYFHPDRSYHFDASGRLRRAFVDGHLYRTQGSTLARLTRKRTETESTLMRYDLTADELTTFVDTMKHHVQQLIAQLRKGTAQIVRVIPDDAGFPDRLTAALEQPLTVDTPLAPPFPTRRR